MSSALLSLLSAARTLLEAIPEWRLGTHHRRLRERLVGQIDSLFAENGIIDFPAAVMHDLRARYRSQTDIKIDMYPVMRREGEVLWVSAWLSVRPPAVAFGSEQFKTALGALPLMAREVYRLHLIEGRCLQEVARKLGLTGAEVEGQLALALRGLHEQLFSRN